jgi:hypothetical protein
MSARSCAVLGNSMPLFTDPQARDGWSQALAQMQSALKILDDTQAPEDIGPHLDLAICRLEHAMGRNSAENSVSNLHKHIDEAFATAMAERSREMAPIAW